MKIHTLSLVISMAFLSCNKISDVEKQATEKQMNSLWVNKDALRLVPANKGVPKTQNWYDDLMADYIRKSDNEIIKLSLKNKEQIEWLLDRTEKTDSTNYYIFKIGHDVSEEDRSELRCTSDGWIYIDSISKKIFEYDLSNETLILWKYNSKQLSQ